MLAMLIGCGLRRGELLSLHVDSIQLREEHWVISDLASNRMRTADRQNPWAADRPPLGDYPLVNPRRVPHHRFWVTRYPGTTVRDGTTNHMCGFADYTAKWIQARQPDRT